MIFILAVIITVISLAIIFLILKADKNMAKALLLSIIRDKRYVIADNELKKEACISKMIENGYEPDSKAVKKKIKEFDKKQKEHTDKISALKKGKMSILDLIPLIGYSALALIKLDANNTFYKKIHLMFLQLEERSEAGNNTNYLIARIISYVAVGLDITLIIMALTFAADLGKRGLIMCLVALVMTVVIAYIPYDDISSKTRKRGESIDRDFAGMVSKLTLLVGAGMEVSKAWELASAKGAGVLFVEMRRVSDELNNNISPVVAYGNFIDRCNNKYTTKLATSIIQNISKGNSEIVKLFREITDESWNDKRHNARRMGEAVSGKLVIPTMLLFAGILLLVMGPAMFSFSNTGIG